MAATMAPAPMLASSSVKVPAPPPSSPLATSGSRAMRAVACKKKTEMRHSTARIAGRLAHKLHAHAHGAGQALTPQRAGHVLCASSA